MKQYGTLISFIFLLILTSCKDNTGGHEEPEPELEISGIQPDEGPAGTTVTISGSGFSPEVSENSVTFSGTKASIEDAAESEVKAVVPGEAESGPIEIKVGEKTATGPAFTIKDESPVIESIEPDSGVAGTEVVITGLNFSTDPSEVLVRFDGTEAEVSSASVKELITKVPEGASDGSVELEIGEESATGPDFNIITCGALEVQVETSGDDKDENGYILEIDNEEKESEANDTVYFNYLEVGSYDLELTGIAENCSINGDNPKSFDIAAGDTTMVEMNVHCTASDGDLLKDKIVFVSDQVDYREEIFSVNPDGSDFTQLTHNSEKDKWIPSVSPDGSKIAFVSGEEIFIMNADGSDITAFPYEGSHPSWSPDGNRLTFSSEMDHRSGSIYTSKLDGSDLNRLTTGTDKFDSDPDWAPKGNKIAFRRSETEGVNIYTIKPDGTGLTQQTEDEGKNEDPAWSPDGSRIAFVSDRDGYYAELYIMNADGSNPVRMTSNSEIDKYPSWSPDGSEIVFSSRPSGDYRLFTIDVQSKDVTEVSEPSIDYSDNDQPSWSPVK